MKTQEQNALILDNQILGREDFGLPIHCRLWLQDLEMCLS